MNTTKKTILGFGLLVVLLVMFALWRSKSPLGQNLKNDSTLSEKSKTSEDLNSTPTTTEEQVKPVNTARKLNYGEAIKKYPYRIQFTNCNGNPGTVSLKRNTALMLDNRDSKSHAVKLAGKTYILKAYDYELAYVSLEGTYNLTCDGGGAASVNIER